MNNKDFVDFFGENTQPEKKVEAPKKVEPQIKKEDLPWHVDTDGPELKKNTVVSNRWSAIQDERVPYVDNNPLGVHNVKFEGVNFKKNGEGYSWIQYLTRIDNAAQAAVTFNRFFPPNIHNYENMERNDQIRVIKHLKELNTIIAQVTDLTKENVNKLISNKMTELVDKDTETSIGSDIISKPNCTLTIKSYKSQDVDRKYYVLRPVKVGK